MTRKVDITFGDTEKVWRSVDAKGLDSKGNIKPNQLRLQISVARERHGTRELALNPTRPEKNGIVEAEALTLMNAGVGDVHVACIDEPLESNEAHALVAFHVRPGVIPSEQEIATVRAAVAAAMRVVVPPTKTAKAV